LIGNNGENLAFLLSMPRSGSTLLSMMLGGHPEICCPPEPWIVLAVAEYLKLGNVNAVPYGREWAEIAAMEFLLKPERKVRGSLNAMVQVRGAKVGKSPVDKAKFVLRSAYQSHLKTTGKSVFVDKTPRYYAVLNLIDELFPKAKKIVLLRNPLDIWASHKATWNISRDIFSPHGVTVTTRDFCEGLFEVEKAAVESGENILVIRYEELAINPEAVLRSACEFVGLTFSDSMLTYYENAELVDEYKKSAVGDPVLSSQPKPANKLTVNAWERRLDKEDIQAVISVTGIGIFERMGYGETAEKLRGLDLQIPTEDQAKERRAQLMSALIAGTEEEPFALWNNFISPLKELKKYSETFEADRLEKMDTIYRLQTAQHDLQKSLQVSESDRAQRLDVIHQLQATERELRKSLEISELDRAARLEFIHQQKATENALRHSLEILEADKSASLELTRQLEATGAELRKNLEISELDRARKIELIHQKNVSEMELKKFLEESEADRAARLDFIHQLQAIEKELREHLQNAESDSAQRLEVIKQQQTTESELRKNLEISELDRAARLDFIHQQQATESALRRHLEDLESDRLIRQEITKQMQELQNEFVRSNEIAESERLARFDERKRQAIDEAELRHKLETLEAERIASIKVIYDHEIFGKELERNLEISENERLAGLEVILQQKALDKELKHKLDLLEIDQSENQQLIRRLENELNQMKLQLHEAENSIEKLNHKLLNIESKAIFRILRKLGFFKNK